MRAFSVVSSTTLALIACSSGSKGDVSSLLSPDVSRHTVSTSGYVVALQGLQPNTLVAGKTTALRLFTDPATYDAAARIEATIIRPDGSRLVRSWSVLEAVAIPDSSSGPSLVVRVPGSDLPWVGGYNLQANVFDADNNLLASYAVDQAQMLPTKDLRVMVHRIWAGDVNPGTPAEIQAAHDAMQRMASLYPVRDGVSILDGDRSAGLRYLVDNNPRGPPCQDCDICPLFSSWLGRPPDVDSIDVGITYRFPDSGEGCGGNSRHVCSGQSLLWSVIVWQQPLPQVFCQETGHNFGLEPPEDPHYDGTGHSRHYTIDAYDAELGFDIQFNRAFPNPTYDVMFPTGPCPGWEPSVLSLNSWDWEYLRRQIATLRSTGPTAPASFISDVGPGAAGVGNNIYFLGRRRDGRVYYNRAVLGQAGVGWVEMEGGARTDESPVGGAVGTHLFVVIKGLDGSLYLNQADVAQPFGTWIPLSFGTDVTAAVTGVGNNVYVFAKALNGRIFYNRAQLGYSFLGWTEVDGGGVAASAPSAGAVGTHVFVAIKGTDGNLYLNQADLGQSFTFWSSMGFTTDVAPAVTGVGTNVYVFAKSLDGRIFYNRAQLGQSFLGWLEVDGGGRTDSAPSAGAVGNHVFVAIKGLDGTIYINQADLGQPFGYWFP